jgi:hypothetical protein
MSFFGPPNARPGPRSGWTNWGLWKSTGREDVKVTVRSLTLMQSVTETGGVKSPPDSRGK